MASAKRTVALLVVTLAAGCGGDEAPPPSSGRVTVTVGDPVKIG